MGTYYVNGDGITTSAVASGNQIIISSLTPALIWTEVVTTSANMAVNNGYITNNVGLVTLTLPATAAVGSIIEVVGKGGGWVIAQNAGQSIIFESSATTVGVGGSVASSAVGQSCKILCTTANTTFTYINGIGTLNIV